MPRSLALSTTSNLDATVISNPLKKQCKNRVSQQTLSPGDFVSAFNIRCDFKGHLYSQGDCRNCATPPLQKYYTGTICPICLSCNLSFHRFVRQRQRIIRVRRLEIGTFKVRRKELRLELSAHLQLASHDCYVLSCQQPNRRRSSNTPPILSRCR